MPIDRRQRLEAISFEWDILSAAWKQGFTALEDFKAREGHCRVPTTFVEGAYRLGRWVSVQRSTKETLSDDRRQQLEAIGFEWDLITSARESAWKQGFTALEDFNAREGHCRVPSTFIEGAYRLGQWVSVQRSTKETLSDDRRQQLEAIGFEWDLITSARESAWEQGFTALEDFKGREGHCRVPQRFAEHGFNLGAWVGTQRKARETMSVEHRQRLDNLGFEWDPLSADWEHGYAELESFKIREGHCRVPQRYVVEGFKLGQWIGVQRKARETISAERRQRLDTIGFEWDSLSADWERAFTALKNFKARERHCRVPDAFVEDGFKLGLWVRYQRKARETIPAGRRQRLDEIGFVWRVAK